MAINRIVSKKFSTNTLTKSYDLDEAVGTLLIRVTGTEDVFIYFDDNPKSEAFLVPRDRLMPPINVNSNKINFYSLADSSISFLSWG